VKVVFWSSKRQVRRGIRLKSRGFTVVELIVVIGIISIVFAAGWLYFRQLGHSQPKLLDRLLVNQEGIRSANILIEHVRECLEVIKPEVGETTPYLVTRNALNEINVIYCQEDKASSDDENKVYQLVAVSTDDKSGVLSDQAKNELVFSRRNMGMQTEKVLIRLVKRVTFTATNPNQVKFNLVLQQGTGQFAYVSQVRLLPYGGL
jgi:prepilin-type N-terminal cleavage/methylation domain-containing protein